MTIKYYANSTGSEKLEEVDEEEQLMWQSEHKQRSNYNHEDEEDLIEEEEEEENEDDELMIEDASSMSSSPSIPDEDINFDLVYALHTFVATVEGQASVVKGDALILMEDTNIYWWLVEVLKTREVGYIPAENIETPYERLARLNKHRNVEITSPSIHDIAPPLSTTHPLHTGRKVTIGDELCLQIFEYEVESDYEDEEEDGIEDIMEEEEDTVEHEKIQIQNKSSEFQEITYDHTEDIIEHQQPEWRETNWEDDSLSTTTTAAAAMATEISPLEVVSKEEEPPQQKMDLRVFAGNIGQGPLFHTFSVLVVTTADDLIKTAVDRFNVMRNIEPSENTTIEYYLAVQGMDGDEYILSAQDKPYSIFKTLTDSLTTPMPSLTHIKRISQQSISSNLSTSSRRPRSSSFSNYEETSYGEDSVIRFYLHRRIKRAVEREGLIYIKVSLYPDETSMTTSVPLPAISSHAFIKNPTTPSLRLNNKKSRQQQQKQKSEIDRIDKIISVRKEHPIGVVINLALEKFHVPDAQADDYFEFSNGQGDNSRQLGKYRMSIRSNHQETDLNPNQIMSNVLLEQQNSTPNYQGGPITSDLLFVLRKAGKTGSQKSRHTSSTGNKLLPSQLLTSNISITAEDRRPSILDILMDSTPKFTGERRPSVMSSLLDPLPPVTTRFAEDNNNNNNRRPSGQERKSSLNNINTAQQQSPSTTSSSSSFPISKSPPHRRSSIQSSSILSSSTLSLAVDTNNHEFMDNQITPTSSSSIMTKSMQQTPSASTSTEVYKRKESLKQQFKRFVGWGSPTPSSSSSSSKKSIPPPLTTTGIESPSDISFVSAPSTPLPPTPSTPRSFTTKSRQGSQQLLLHGDSKLSNMEVNESVISTTPAEAEVEPSAAAIAVTQAIVNNNRLSTVSSVSSVSSNSSTSSVTSEEIAEATKKGLEINSESDDEVDSESIADVKSSTATLPKQSSEEPEDIQTQYALWMNSQPPNAVKEETVPSAAFISKALPPLAVVATTAAAVPPTSPIPARNPLRNKSSTISNNTNTTVSQSTAPSIISTTTTVVTTMANQKEETLHPMPAVNHGGQQDLDDLFLLVAHGVDFLTTRENTKWEEEGGYEFHPWNRPQSSFAVKHEQQRKDKDMPPLPTQEGGEIEEDVSSGGSTSEALAMARSLLLSPISPSQQTSAVLEEEQVEEDESNKPISPPLTPLPQLPAQDQQQQQQEALSLAKRILSGKNEAQTVTTSFAQPSQQSVDDEELQRIVASHIVF